MSVEHSTSSQAIQAPQTSSRDEQPGEILRSCPLTLLGGLDRRTVAHHIWPHAARRLKSPFAGTCDLWEGFRVSGILAKQSLLGLRIPTPRV